MAYNEIRRIRNLIKRRSEQDTNNPYRVRSRDGSIDRFGQQEYDYRSVNMLTQPLGHKEYSRLDQGDKQRTWRFAGLIPPNELKLTDQVEYKGQWFEVRKINDWDTVMSAHMVAVT